MTRHAEVWPIGLAVLGVLGFGAGLAVSGHGDRADRIVTRERTVTRQTTVRVPVPIPTPVKATVPAPVLPTNTVTDPKLGRLRIYTVMPGDNLATVAQAFGVLPGQLHLWTYGRVLPPSDPARVVPGDQIVIPTR